jgi:uncharacterized phage protein gp47/JayE
MAIQFEIKTPQQLRDDWEAEVIANFPDAKPKLVVSFFRILGKAHALLLHGLYLFLNNLGNQIFVTLASDEFLDRHGSEYGVTRKPALAAVGNTTATGTNTTAIPTGTRLQDNSGQLYEVVTGQVIAAGSALLPIRALSFGAATNQPAGTTLTFVTPIAGVSTDTTVDGSGLIGGADRESDDSLRQRILFKKRNPSQSGSASDYVTWAKSVADVTRAFVFPKEDGLGTVRVRFMMDDKYSDGIPSAGDVTVVDAFIDPLKPAQVGLTVSAPVAQVLVVDVAIKPNNSDTQTAVTNSVQDMVLRDAVPGGSITISKIRQAISNAVGEDDNVVNSPVADVTTPDNDTIITLGTPIYSTLP